MFVYLDSNHFGLPSVRIEASLEIATCEEQELFAKQIVLKGIEVGTLHLRNQLHSLKIQ